MKTLVGTVTTLTLVLTLSAAAQAQNKNKTRDAQPTAIKQLNKSLKKVELTAEQQASIKEILAKHRGSLAELQKTRQTLLGPEATKKMAEARKAATAEGKKGKQLQAAVQEAAGLSEEKAKELNELQQKTTAASTKLKQAVLALLSDEQKEASGIKVRARKNASKAKNKAAAE